MNCERIEDLLPLYTGGELPEGDRRSVEDHLASCASCREALAAYRELESSLVSRSALRPPASRTASAVVARLGLGRRRRPFLGRIGVPAYASAGFVLVGVVLFFFRGAVADFFARAGQQMAAGHSRIAVEWTHGLVQAAGGSEWMLLSVYLAVFAIIMLAGSWMVLRFVRE